MTYRFVVNNMYITGAFAQDVAKNDNPGPGAVKSPAKQHTHGPAAAKESSSEMTEKIVDNVPNSKPGPSASSARDKVSEVATKKDGEQRSRVAKSPEKSGVRPGAPNESSSGRSILTPTSPSKCPAELTVGLQSNVTDAVAANRAEQRPSVVKSPAKHNTGSANTVDLSPERQPKSPAELRVRLQSWVADAAVTQDKADKDGTKLLLLPSKPRTATRESETKKPRMESSPGRGKKTVGDVPPANSEPRPSTSKEPRPSTSREPQPSTSHAVKKNVSARPVAISDDSSDSDSFLDGDDDYGYREPRTKRWKKAQGPRRVWSSAEEEMVYKGVKAHGVGNWARIRCTHVPQRSNVDIKDKWRTMLRQGRLEDLARKFGPLSQSRPYM